LCVDFSTLRQSPKALQTLQAGYNSYARDFVLDNEMHESMIGIHPIDAGATALGNGGHHNGQGDDGDGYLEQPIWQIAPFGFVVVMETRTDARLVAQALSSLRLTEEMAEERSTTQQTEERSTTQQTIVSDDISDFF
jgi:hypothetical protein